MKERGISFNEALNSAVRAGLTQGKPKRRSFVQKSYALGADQNFRSDKALETAGAMEDEELGRNSLCGNDRSGPSPMVLRACHNRVTVIFMSMRGITIKLPDTTLRLLRQQARETGRSVAALVRERVEAPPDDAGESVFSLTSDLAGALAGGRRPAANTRRKFRRS